MVQITRCRCGRFTQTVCRRCWSRHVTGLRTRLVEARERWTGHRTPPPNEPART